MKEKIKMRIVGGYLFLKTILKIIFNKKCQKQDDFRFGKD